MEEGAEEAMLPPPLSLAISADLGALCSVATLAERRSGGPSFRQHLRPLLRDELRLLLLRLRLHITTAEERLRFGLAAAATQHSEEEEKGKDKKAKTKNCSSFRRQRRPRRECTIVE